MKGSKYDSIGFGYNSTRQADPHLLERIYVLLSPRENGSYLDIGCGTGNYTIALERRGLNMSGIDPSDKMLDEAKARSPHVVWMSGSAEQIPFADHSFEGAVATLTIHHWEDVKAGFKEVSRVLRPGSRIVIFTSSPEQMSGYWLNRYFPEVMDRSIKKMPSISFVEEALKNAGLIVVNFEKYFVRDDLTDLFLQSGKNRPEIYFDDNVRKGISTFASLATKEEMDSGLKKLREELDAGLFQAIKTKHDNDMGDYLFIVAQKSHADRLFLRK